MQVKTFLVILFITLTGALIRFHNISPYKIYPDTYQNLLVAQNLAKYKSVVGFLGEGGMIYPPYFAWSRPVYPLLMNFLNLFIPDLVSSAIIVSFIFGVLTIPLAFYLIKIIFNSERQGIFAAALLALSFNHAVWSGFIETEAIAIFFMMLFLLSFFAGLKKVSKLANLNDLITGNLLSLALMSRYEYIVIFLPILLFLVLTKQFSFAKIINILASFILTTTIFMVSLFPVSETIAVILGQNQKMIYLSIGTLVASLLLIFAKKHISRISSFVIIPLWIISFYLFLQILWPKIFYPFYNELLFIRDFFKGDLLLGVTSLFGFTVLLRKGKYQAIGFFSLFSALIFSVLYFNVNSTMQRYITHTIPFLLIASSFALDFILKNFKTGLIILASIQLILTFNGIRNWYSGEWFRVSYSEKAAKEVNKRLTSPNTLLIVSFPEPYYYFSHHTTQSITDTPPYIYLDNLSEQTDVIIVEDMGMRDIFPNFSKILENNFSNVKIDQFWIGEKYHYKTYSKTENQPVILYKMNLEELKRVLRSTY